MLLKLGTKRSANTTPHLPLFGFIFFILYDCASGHHGPFIENPPPLRNIVAFREQLQKAVFTVETPKALLWEDRLKMQKMAVEMLIDNYAKYVIP